jgi:hypothetical protein
MLRDVLLVVTLPPTPIRPCEGTCDETDETDCVGCIGGKNLGERGLGGYNLLCREDTDFDLDIDVLAEDLE